MGAEGDYRTVTGAFYGHSDRMFNSLGGKTNWATTELKQIYTDLMLDRSHPVLRVHRKLYFEALSGKKGWGRGECMRLYHKIKKEVLGVPDRNVMPEL